MKKTYLYLLLGIVLIILGIVNLSFEIDSKGHYFSNGILCGIGISILYVQILKLRNPKAN